MVSRDQLGALLRILYNTHLVISRLGILLMNKYIILALSTLTLIVSTKEASSFKGLEIRAEKSLPPGGQQADKKAVSEDKKIYVYKDGKLSEGFDPLITSKTCQAAPKQIKIFDP